MNSVLTTIKNFYVYQRERFPIILLAISFLPAILSSSAVVTLKTEVTFVLSALTVSIAYLLHVRIVDEFRDYEHDLRHHTDRPVSSGVISLSELRVIDTLAMIVIVGVAWSVSYQAVFFVIVMLLYTDLARREFFIGQYLKQHFYLYNAVNLVQMLLLQVLVYVLANSAFALTVLVSVHFLFTTTGTIIFEFLRKVKSPGDDGTGSDTYTWFLGFKQAIIVYTILATLNILLFVKAMFLIAPSLAFWGHLSVVVVLAMYGTALMQIIRKDTRTNQLMQLSFLVMYGMFNLLLFLAV